MSSERIRENFGRIWPVHVANFVELLISCRRAVGDLDLLLVLAVIGDRNMSERRTDGIRSHRELFLEWTGRPEPEHINTQSIADFTGIPRETVRRKINELVARGWVEKTKGLLVITRKCADDLAPTTERGIAYLSTMFDLFAAMKARD